MKKPDRLSRKAKRDKVRARSYYKLQEIDKKFRILIGKKRILDLGCAPGGWLLYLDKNSTASEIVGIDVLEVKNKAQFSDRVKIIKEDFREYISDKQFDLILCDIAPEFTGIKERDYKNAYDLNIKTIKLSTKLLSNNGILVMKTFQNEYLEEIEKLIRKKFKKYKLYKPLSSRASSPEIYVIGFSLSPYRKNKQI